MIKLFRIIRQKMLTEGKFSKYLIYTIGEIVLVVIGILIALQINNWNEGQNSLKDEGLYLSRLLSENKQDIVTFEGFIKDLEKGNETIENLSVVLKSNTLNDSLVVNAANEYFKYGSILSIFSSSKSTFDDLSSTGNLKVIRNIYLRDSIVLHYAKQKKVEERIQIAIDWALPLDGPFTAQNDIMKFEPSTSFLFPEVSYKILAKELRDKNVTYISNSAAHYWINKDAIGLFQELIQQTTFLIKKLEYEIDN